MDTLTKEKRSRNISRIRSKNTRPEMVVCSLLHRMRYRFCLHRKDSPGKPDIVKCTPLSRQNLLPFKV